MNFEHAPRAIASAARWLLLFIIIIFGFLYWLDANNKQLSWSPLGLFDKTPVKFIEGSKPEMGQESRKNVSETENGKNVIELAQEPVQETVKKTENKANEVTIDNNKENIPNEPQVTITESRQPIATPDSDKLANVIPQKNTIDVSARGKGILNVSDTGDGSISFSAPANRPVSIKSTKNASFSQRFNLFRMSVGTGEWVHVESKTGTNYYLISAVNSRSEYIVTAENKDTRWVRSTTKSIRKARGKTEVRFEDDGFNISAGSDYDLLLEIWMD